jgi:hypothetical protein
VVIYWDKGKIMSKTYTVTLSDAEDKALGYVALSQEDWINNAIHERCRVAIDEIVNAEVQRKLSIGESIVGSKEDIVMAAQIQSAAQRSGEVESKLEGN